VKVGEFRNKDCESEWFDWCD